MKHRKILSVVLVLAMLISFGTVSALAATETTEYLECSGLAVNYTTEYPVVAPADGAFGISGPTMAVEGTCMNLSLPTSDANVTLQPAQGFDPSLYTVKAGTTVEINVSATVEDSWGAFGGDVTYNDYDECIATYNNNDPQTDAWDFWNLEWRVSSVAYGSEQPVVLSEDDSTGDIKLYLTAQDAGDVSVVIGNANSNEVYGVVLVKVVKDSVAKVGDTEYATLGEAFAAANATENATVTLLADYDMEANEPGYGWTTSYVAAGETTPRDNMLEISGNGLTFDLGGHTLSNLYNNTFKVTGENVTIQNGTMTIGTLYAGSYSKGKVTAYATPRPCSYVVLTNGAENFTINDLNTTGGINISDGTTAVVNGLNFSGASYYAICSQEDSDVTINGGTFDKATAGYANYLIWVDGETNSTMTINGGTFLKGTAKFLVANDGEPVIYGGTFDFDPSAYVADGYEAVANGDGTYSVENAYVAKVGDTKYDTLASAITAANAIDGATVTLLKDYDMEANEPGYGWTTSYVAAGETTPRDNMIAVSGKGLTIDLNGHTLSNLYNNTFKVTGEDVTIENGTMVIGTLYAGSYSKGKVTTYATPRLCSYVVLTEGAKNFTINDLTTTGGINISDYTTATVNGLNFSGASYYAICSQAYSDVTINGGTFDKATAGYANYLVWVDGDETSTMTINGGTFLKGTAKFAVVDANPVVKGGTFDFDPTAYVADGYEVIDNNDGTYTVSNIDLVTGHNISVEGYIDLNFYLDVTEEQVEEKETVVTFSWENGSTNQTLEASDLTENGYKAQVPDLPAAEMTMPVTATVTVDGEVIGVSDAYSVRDYAMEIINTSTDPELVDLVENMLVYGAAAQAVFNVNGEGAADEFIDLDLADVDAADIDEAIAEANNGAVSSDMNEVAAQIGGDFYTTSLIFLSGNTLRHYFTGKLHPGNFTGVKSNYYFYVEKTDIKVDQLDELQEFHVGTVVFYYSALDYVKNVLATAPEGSAAYNLAVATFMYNQAANTYFD